MSDVGEIIGRLKLDASDWMAKIDEAEAKAEGLKGVDPHIRVTADTAGAISGLMAVRQAAIALSAEQYRLQDANRALRAATMDYSKALEKEGQDSAAAGNALDRYIAAKDRVAKSSANLTRLQGALTDAEKAQAAAAKAAGTAQNDLADKTKKTGNAAQGAIPWMGILAGSAAALSPAIVAVGAAAAGLSIELSGLGAAGVLAFAGIKAQMAAGTALGQQYADLFGGLTSNLENLQTVAAAGVFTGLSAGISTLNGDIVPLSTTVALLSTQLGGLLATGADTAVHAINSLTPLLLSAGGAMQQFLQGVDGFTQSNGFTQFVSYTEARLPDVMHLLQETLGAAGSLLGALAPAGQPALFMLSSLVDLVRSLAPTVGALMPVLTGVFDALGGIALVAASVLNALGPVGPALIGTTGAFVGLSFAAKALAPAMAAAADAEGAAALATRGLGAAVDFAMGPLGLAVIAAGLLASALPSVIAGNQGATIATEDYTAALEQDNGAIGANTTAQVANALAKAGAFEQGKLLGINQQTLTQATLGNAQALAVVNQKTQQATQSMGSYAAAHGGLTDKQRTLTAAVNGVRGAIGSQSSALHSQITNYRDVAAATGQATTAARANSAALTAQTPITTSLTAAQKAQIQALRDAAEGFRTDNAAAKTLGDTYDAVTVSTDGLIKALQASKGNLNEDTLAGAQNATMFRTSITDIKAHADAINADGQHAAAARAYTLQHVKSLEDQAVAAGADKGKVDALVASLVNVSRQHPLSKIDVQTADFLAKVEAVRSQMAAINGLTSTVYVTAVASGVSLNQSAIINRQAAILGYAAGGTAGQLPGLAMGGSGLASIPGLADGGGLGYTVSGPGTSWNDLAGIFRLANGEEVVSDMRGGAAYFRNALKSISNGAIRNWDQLADYAGARATRHGPTTVINRTIAPEIHVHNPVAVDPVTQSVEAAQHALAYAGLA